MFSGSPVDNFDLHNHSTSSDGLLSPTALIELAARNGTHAIALTDHDTVDGVAEAAQAAQAHGIRLVPGVEISVSWGDTTLHVVGLNVDPMAPALVAGLNSIRDGRFGRGQVIAQGLEKLGFAGTLEGALALAKRPDQLSRAHFARYMAERGWVKDTQQAFDKYLAKGKPAFVPHRWADLGDAVGWIRSAGGVAGFSGPRRDHPPPVMRGEEGQPIGRLRGEGGERGGG